MCVCVCISVHVCVYVYIHTQRETTLSTSRSPCLPFIVDSALSALKSQSHLVVIERLQKQKSPSPFYRGKGWRQDKQRGQSHTTTRCSHPVCLVPKSVRIIATILEGTYKTPGECSLQKAKPWAHFLIQKIHLEGGIIHKH